ncbi:hypothetical protein A2837_02185 [Candidatus Kaiserbacteria bacterium RIFCSPHIGHO2_01_FULL_46_22]|uniref:Uncharacterized protein n=1 Tax=Candidatus Kaiserbacteria bacterium RIFCSPHIGHO2_01_FULL_46_22 TaxID=1798475 RepID=A0A1F6BYU8_9BACT|nr:MAG: hypothetical protein A2837_02185 [Candidatus Kaiserbacteria bacterium RIFCSPHIGHO2_01_FULL_46_22]
MDYGKLPTAEIDTFFRRVDTEVTTYSQFGQERNESPDATADINDFVIVSKVAKDSSCEAVHPNRGVGQVSLFRQIVVMFDRLAFAV